MITGAGSGIGRAAAQSLGRRGARVVVTDVDAERARSVASEIGDAAIHVRCDVTVLSDFEEVLDVTLRRFGQVDIVMNNVAVLAVGRVEDIPLDAWQRSLDINLLGIVRNNLVFLPSLLAQGRGHIVNTASMAGLLPYGYDRLPYTATKHAVVGLSESLALYLRPLGVGVTCLCPAGVATNIVEQMTFYGNPGPLRSPDLQVSSPETVGELVPHQATFARFETARSASWSLWRLRQAM